MVLIHPAVGLLIRTGEEKFDHVGPGIFLIAHDCKCVCWLHAATEHIHVGMTQKEIWFMMSGWRDALSNWPADMNGRYVFDYEKRKRANLPLGALTLTSCWQAIWLAVEATNGPPGRTQNVSACN